MAVCSHFSQRATCPPRAAVRQPSIALITFSCPRLTWPRLASCQAAPWSRKISAASRTGRGTWADLLDRLRRWSRDRDRQRQAVERALDRAQDVGGNVRVARGRVELRMPKQHLDDSDIDPGLHQ